MSEGFGQVRPPGANIPGYLLPASIAATLLCCLPTGTIAIAYSAQARSKSEAGDYAGASHAARNANIWLIVTVIGGIVGWLVFLFVLLPSLLIFIGAATEQYQYANP